MKALAAIVIGFVLGGVVTYLVIRSFPTVADDDLRTMPRLQVGDRSLALAGASSDYLPLFRDRLATLRAVADVENFDSLLNLVEQTAASEPSSDRALQMEALLARITEMNPERALEFVTSRVLEPQLIETAYRYAAAVDPEAALRSLGLIADRATRISTAVRLMADLGYDDADRIGVIGRSLPENDREHFQIERLAWRARVNPESAIDEMLRIPSQYSQESAAREIATIWAQLDPRRAMDAAADWPAEQATEFRSAISAEWARLDPEGFLSYLTAGAPASDVSGGVQLFLAADPEGLWRAADTMPDGRSLKMIALTALAAKDPLAATTRVDEMPPGRERDGFVTMVALSYASDNPDGALAWLDRITPPVPTAQLAVAASIAGQDINRALDMIGSSTGTESDLLFGALGAAVAEASQDRDQASRMASDLLARRDTLGSQTLASLLTDWMQHDADAAIDWIGNTSEDIDHRIINTAAMTLARRDPDLAAGYTNRIPEQHQDAWIVQVASAYGRNDAAEALRFIAPYSGRAVYDQAYGHILVQSAQSDPQGAARLMTSAQRVAQLAAAGPIASAWAGQNAFAARDWALGLPRGEVRDEALTAILASGATASNVGELIDAFSSDVAQQQALARSINIVASTDRERALELLETYVTDADIRRRLSESIGEPAGR